MVQRSMSYESLPGQEKQPMRRLPTAALVAVSAGRHQLRRRQSQSHNRRPMTSTRPSPYQLRHPVRELHG